MPHHPTAHTGAALRHLRLLVFVSAGVVGVSLLAQLLVWAFVHFTDLRWTEIEPELAPSPDRLVVRSTGPRPRQAQTPPPGAPEQGDSGNAARAQRPVGGPAQARPVVEVDPNRVPSPHDRNLRAAALFVQTAGGVGVVVLALMVFQGVLIAAGAGTPGVERAVTACSWTLAIALLCMPIQSVAAAWPFSGVFSSYDAMTAASDALQAGAEDAPSVASFYASFLFFPLLCFVALAIAVYRFATGIEASAVVTSVSEAEQRLEREMASIRIGNHAGGRTAGALSRAISVHSDDEEVSPSLTRAGDNPLKRTCSAREEVDPGGRSISKPGAGEPLKRPI